MNDEFEERLSRTSVVPLVQSADPETAIRVTEALVEGGLSIIEVVLRTDEALDCLSAIRRSCPDALVGAGTVLGERQAIASIGAGASFIVSPGLDESVVAVATASNIPVIPGVATATEVQRAWNLNLRVVKFFPAGIVGGTRMLMAWSSVFRNMKFMPTGGISARNLAEYVSIPSVLACGGSWLTPANVVESGDFQRISELAREAVEIVRSTRRK